MTREWGWLRLATHLRMSLQRVKAETTSSEYVLWMVYLDAMMNHHEKLDYFLAQIACEMRRFVSKDPNSPTIEEFLLKFNDKDEGTKEKEDVKETERVKMERMRMQHFQALGYVQVVEEEKDIPPWILAFKDNVFQSLPTDHKVHSNLHLFKGVNNVGSQVG